MHNCVSIQLHKIVVWLKTERLEQANKKLHKNKTFRWKCYIIDEVDPFGLINKLTEIKIKTDKCSPDHDNVHCTNYVIFCFLDFLTRTAQRNVYVNHCELIFCNTLLHRL